MKSNLTQDLEPSLFKFLNTDSSPIRKHVELCHPPIPNMTPPKQHPDTHTALIIDRIEDLES